MFGVMVAGLGSTGAATDPLDIFGADLELWLDAAVDVTDVDYITEWGNQGTGQASITNATTGATYVASQGDGTPSADFSGGDSFYYTDAINDAFTVYMFADATTANLIRCLMWSNTGSLLSLWHTGYQVGPAIYRGSWSESGFDPQGWHVCRWTLNNSGAADSSIALDDGAEAVYSLNWTSGQSWQYLSRGGSNQGLIAQVKHIMLIKGAINDADPRHQQMLDYFKLRHPTLVSY